MTYRTLRPILLVTVAALGFDAMKRAGGNSVAPADAEQNHLYQAYLQSEEFAAA